MKSALHAEWTKMRTVAGPWWLLISAIVSTVALGVAASSVADHFADPTRTALTGVVLGQAPVIILAVLVIGGEYSTGMIRVSLTAVPRRNTVLAAKAVILTGAVAVSGSVAVLGSLVQAPAGEGGHTSRAAVGSILYLILIALLSLGVATMVRDSAASIGVVLALLFLFPILAQNVGHPRAQRLLEQVGPMSAGLNVQATTDLAALPMPPWAGLAVTATWSVTALIAGAVLMKRRDT